MNIFYINEDPIIAARELADDYIRKMQIESAQMCCTAHWAIGGEAPYKRAHLNHPSTKWVRESIQHYRRLIAHSLEISNEFEKRYGKSHKTKEVLEWCKINEPNIPDNGFVAPPQCMPDEFKSKEHLFQEMDSLICASAMREVMLGAFGDHCEVTVTKDGIDVDHYEHE